MRWRLPFALLGSGLLSSASAWATESAGFTLETGSPDALCPELEVTREVVARRLGSLVVEGRKGWRARYTIGHAPFGSPRDFVRLELFSPEGKIELQRDLPIEGDSCRTMAEVIALVLDRYFRGVGMDGVQAAEPAPAAAPRPPPARPPPAASSRARAPAPAPVPRNPLAHRVSAEYAVTQPVAQPWLGLRFSTAPSASFEFGLALRLDLTPLRERAARGASVEARTVATRLGIAWRHALPVGMLHIGPALSLMVQRAATHGLANSRDRTRALFAAGAEAGIVVPVARRLFVETAIFADVLGSSAHFVIDEHEVLSPRRLTLGWSLGFGYSWGR